jgi:hypothetical protein
MRDLGYSLETALADVIDNSITAAAATVEILFDAGGGEPAIGILDDGYGMSRDTLLEAMRPGTVGPLEARDSSDLGRFGLGLKTASFSQCRRLTVLSRTDGVLTGARWDLDVVAVENKWLLEVLGDEDVDGVPWCDLLPRSGTLVVWENLDRLVDTTTGSDCVDHLYDRLDSAHRHLSLVFHRYLQGEKPLRKVSFKVNGTAVQPFDPFNSRNLATQKLPCEHIQVDGHTVEVQPFILPHHRKVSSAEYERHAGEGGYLANQGFYVYRNGRLIIHGTWFRLAKRTELTKLARVRVDMPTGLDNLWKINVLKASVQPPYIVKERLRGIVERITGASGRVYTSRGATSKPPGVTPLWVRRVDKNEVFYEINRSHPLLHRFSELLTEDGQTLFESILEVIEHHFPADAFFSDVAGSPESMKQPSISDEVLRPLIDLFLDSLLNQGMTSEEIAKAMETTEPYRSHMDAVLSVLKEKGVLSNVH